jgi:Cu/Ag efflux protein CusF
VESRDLVVISQEFLMKTRLFFGLMLGCLLLASYSYGQDSQSSSPTQGQTSDQSQGPNGPRHRGQGGDVFREMFQNATSGSVQAISADGMTVKKMDGTVVTVKTTKDTMFRRNREEAKLSDFKAGDQVIVAGEPAGENAVTAKFVAERPSGPNMMNPEDLGKKFIVGEVLKIEDTKLTVKRPDGVEQVIEVDDDTSFRNAKRESVTLADVKVGDRVMGRGELKNGTFVPKEMMVGMPQGGAGGMRRREGPTGAPPDQGGPQSQQPHNPDGTTPKQDF